MVKNIANRMRIDADTSRELVYGYRAMVNDDTYVESEKNYSDRTYSLYRYEGVICFKITVLDSHKRKTVVCDIHDVTGLYVDGNGLTVVSNDPTYSSYTIGVFGDYTIPYVPLDMYEDDMKKKQDTFTMLTSMTDLEVGDVVFCSYTVGSTAYNLLGCKVINKDASGGEDLTISGPMNTVTGTGMVSYTSSMHIPFTAMIQFGWYFRPNEE